MTWLESSYEDMKKACEEKKRKTKGKCEDYECIGIGWCEDCLKAANKAKKEAKK